MEEYVKGSIKASQDEEVIGLYDKELHLEKLRLSELKEVKEKGIEERNIEIAVNDTIRMYKNGKKTMYKNVHKNTPFVHSFVIL